MVDTHTPWFLPVVSVPSSMRCTHSPVNVHLPQTGGWPGGEETGTAAAGEFSKVPRRDFFFLGKSSCSILLLPPYKEGPVLSHSPPLQLDQGLSGSVSHRPNSQLSPASAHSLHGFTTSSLFPSLRLQAIRSLWVLLKPCLAGEGAINLALSQESCGRSSRCGPGAAVALFPVLVPGTFCLEAIPLLSVFSVSSILFGLLSS